MKKLRAVLVIALAGFLLFQTRSASNRNAPKHYTPFPIQNDIGQNGGDPDFTAKGFAPIMGEASAQSMPALDACPFSANSVKAAYAEMITVSNTAVGFTQATYKPTDGRPAAVCAVVFVNTQSISWWPAGRTPTAADGVLAPTASSFSIGILNLQTFLMIRATGSDSLVAVVYQTPAQGS